MVTGWIVKAGPEPTGYVNPCQTNLHESIITGSVPVTVKSCVAEPSPVVNHWNDPVFDHTFSHVTGWIVRAGEAPADYVNPCPSPHVAIITGVIPVTVKSCVSEPSPVVNHWNDPEFDKTYSHVTGWTVRAGEAPANYVDPCTTTTAMLVML